MKKQFFTFLMMIALVIVAGKAMAQSTPKNPFVGATETYTVTGLTNGDTYTFYVTATGVTEDPAAVDLTSGGGVFTWVGVNTNTVASNQASVSIQWNGSAADYLLWIETSRGSCSNYRYVTISPEPNTMDFTITAVGTGNAVYDGDITADVAGASDCAVPFNYEYNDEGTPDDGETYVYYRVNRVDGVTANAWEFDLAMTLDGTGAALANIEFSADGTSGWATQADLLDIPVAGGNDAYYVRLHVVTLTNTDRDVVASISNGLEATTNMGQNPTATANDTDTVELTATPAAGTFSGF